MEQCSIHRVEKGSALAGELLVFVKNCTWVEAKEHIAQNIGNWVFSDWETMFAATVQGRIVGMCSVMKTDYYPLPEIFPWISSVYVAEACRGRRISEQMIAFANRYIEAQGFDRSFIPTGFVGLYEKYGYRFLREITNYGGGTDRLLVKEFHT